MYSLLPRKISQAEDGTVIAAPLVFSEKFGIYSLTEFPVDLKHKYLFTRQVKIVEFSLHWNIPIWQLVRKVIIPIISIPDGG